MVLALVLGIGDRFVAYLLISRETTGVISTIFLGIFDLDNLAFINQGATFLFGLLVELKR